MIKQLKLNKVVFCEKCKTFSGKEFPQRSRKGQTPNNDVR